MSDKIEEALRLILPMAKGYAAAHPVGSNAEYIAQAEEVLRASADGLERATEMPMDDCGLTINTGRDGTWLHFHASSGLSASMNVDVMAAERGNIIGNALREWCADRQAQAETIRSAK